MPVREGGRGRSKRQWIRAGSEGTDAPRRRQDPGRRQHTVAAMSVFTERELHYLAGGRQLGRIATVGADGTPQVVPVAWIYNAARDTIDIGGHELERTKKFRDVARTGRAGIAGDNVSGTYPWRPRGIEVRGRGEAIAMPTPLI